MRVLITTCPEKTFLLSIAPLAWALRTAGHEVRVATSPRLVDAVTQSGHTAVAVGKSVNLARMVSSKRREEGRAGLPPPYDVVDFPARIGWEHMKAGYAYEVTWWHKADNFPMIADLTAFAKHWQPDLVIWEASAYAGAIAAKACGAVHARLLWCLDVFGITREHYLRLKGQQPPGDQADPFAEWLGSYAARNGADYSEDMTCGQFTLEQLPPSLRLHAAGLDYVPMRYTPYGGAATVPNWLWKPPERPRVALTLGLAATNFFNGYAVNVQDILDAVADLDIELVATLEDAEKAKLRAIPDNATIVPFVPLDHLASTCSAVIHHAGFGTMATTTLHGVPQLAVPLHFDEPAFAQKLADHGAGLAVHNDEVTAGVIRENLLRLLREPAFPRRAQDLRDEMLSMPTPNQLVPQLEELTEKHRTS